MRRVHSFAREFAETCGNLCVPDMLHVARFIAITFELEFETTWNTYTGVARCTSQKSHNRSNRSVLRVLTSMVNVENVLGYRICNVDYYTRLDTFLEAALQHHVHEINVRRGMNESFGVEKLDHAQFTIKTDQGRQQAEP